MAKPFIHAQNSARRYGGKWEDYNDIHEFLDSSKGVIGDSRHRALTHTTFFISVVIPRVFGDVRVNSDGKKYSTREIAEQHVLEDYGMRFIPSAQDFLEGMDMKDWMINGKGAPPSHTHVVGKVKSRFIKWEEV